MKEPLVYDTAEVAMRLQMEEEVRAIEALPVVSQLLQLRSSKAKSAGYQATLKCYASRALGGCGKTKEPPVFLTNSRTTLLACACKSFGNVWKCAMVAPVSRPPKNCELWRRLKLVCAYASVSRCTLVMLTYQVLVKVEGN